jgi:hypothetical protein
VSENREPYRRRPEDHLVEPLFAALPEDKPPRPQISADVRWGVWIVFLLAVVLTVALLLSFR